MVPGKEPGLPDSLYTVSPSRSLLIVPTLDHTVAFSIGGNGGLGHGDTKIPWLDRASVIRRDRGSGVLAHPSIPCTFLPVLGVGVPVRGVWTLPCGSPPSLIRCCPRHRWHMHGSGVSSTRGWWLACPLRRGCPRGLGVADCRVGWMCFVGVVRRGPPQGPGYAPPG